MLNIRTTYYYLGKVVKNNKSGNANRAVEKCIAHMQINQYGATFAEVFDNITEEPHASVKRSIQGKITIEYHRDPRNYETRYPVTKFLEDLEAAEQKLTETDQEEK